MICFRGFQLCGAVQVDSVELARTGLDSAEAISGRAAVVPGQNAEIGTARLENADWRLGRDRRERGRLRRPLSRASRGSLAEIMPAHEKTALDCSRAVYGRFGIVARRVRTGVRSLGLHRPAAPAVLRSKAARQRIALRSNRGETVSW
jgi:hypothetical protein